MMTSGLLITDRLVSNGQVPARWALERWITEGHEHAG